jgi:CheY-like chemotaxis protein
LASVLIVDDDRELAEALAEVLGAEGHEPRIARDGSEGLKSVYEREPDLILLDVEMPILDGPGMLRRLDGRDPDQGSTRIILVSGLPRLASLAATLGIRHILRKPFTSETLLRVVQEALSGAPVGR